jgi:hypothetical protein
MQRGKLSGPCVHALRGTPWLALRPMETPMRGKLASALDAGIELVKPVLAASVANKTRPQSLPSNVSLPMRSAPNAAARSRQTCMRVQHRLGHAILQRGSIWHVHRVPASVPKMHRLPVTPPSHTSPPIRSAPTAAAKHRQTRAWYQHCIASGMPSCSVAEYDVSVGCQLQPKIAPNRPQSAPI